MATKNQLNAALKKLNNHRRVKSNHVRYSIKEYKPGKFSLQKSDRNSETGSILYDGKGLLLHINRKIQGYDMAAKRKPNPKKKKAPVRKKKPAPKTQRDYKTKPQKIYLIGTRKLNGRTKYWLNSNGSAFNSVKSKAMIFRTNKQARDYFAKHVEKLISVKMENEQTFFIEDFSINTVDAGKGRKK